ncbi:MAG: Glu/Leu/Phe/Val dehydrogenase [Gammaproteobacteria bacterium]|nr:Glu/Leu/Phe/Val dehydrogenase [Gammaproteobacteria bacterium]
MLVNHLKMMKDSCWQISDTLGPEKIVYINNSAVDLRAIVVVDNTSVGPSIGGVRMAADVTVDECARLARAMTLKNAAAGLPHGGGKAVIAADPKIDPAHKERLIRTFAAAIRELADYIPGPDMGTNETAMAWIRDEIGRSVGLPAEVGGIPLDEIGATGYGLSVSIRAAEKYCEVPIASARVAVQGFGSVGHHAARFLVDLGATLVAAADSSGTIINPDGLDVAALTEHKQQSGTVCGFAHGETGSVDAVLDVECDIWIPAARPDVVHIDNVDRLRTRLVAEGANIPITEEAEEQLAAQGVTVIPDFIANAGGVICAAVEYHGGSKSTALSTIAEKINRNTIDVFEYAKAQSITTRQAANEIAEQRVRKAMSYSRFSH